jgi:4-aminobutyrate aminotransferase-like enzyme/Ser/Thr protein kinase RdoA (MazF antagonist)
MTGPTLDLVFQRPAIGVEHARELAARHWGLEGSATELPSERDRNFLIETATGRRAVLKIANRLEEDSLLELQHIALRRIHAAHHGIAVPEVLPARSGEDLVVESIDGTPHSVRALSWLPGAPLALAKPKTIDLFERLGELIGRIDSALAGLDLPAAHRVLKWDLARAGWITEHLAAVTPPDRRELVERLFGLYRTEVAPRWAELPAGLIHNDANDYNVLVAGRPEDSERVVGLIDFGDLVFTARIAEVAIAAAYAMLGSRDPVGVAAAIVGAYHRITPLTETEIEVCYPLICARLAVSVVNSALQRQAVPDNQYLVISERAAFDLLERLDQIHPRLAHYRFRDAAGLEPCPAGPRIGRWVEAHRSDLVPIVGRGRDDPPPVRVDLSVASPMVDQLSLLADQPGLTARIEALLTESGATIGIGEYDEARLVYTTELFRAEGLEGPEWRTIHLGLDLFGPAGTPVRAPIAGTVSSVRNNPAPGDYGPTVILEHTVTDRTGPLRFHTLYGHLDLEALESLSPGRSLQTGAVVGRLGTSRVNGGWTPHVHFQIIADLLDRAGEFPGVARPGERRVWTSLSPDPHRLAGFGPTAAPEPSSGALLDRRRKLIGPNLSISYRRPLHLVRGWMQHLYDAEGRQFLDAVNNVPHVGHCHPAVVEAGQRQMTLLATNTRYLHPTILRYAERLTATLPEPLRICYFVNSGSEANELALRLAGAHTGRAGVIVVDGAYHGNTRTLVEISPYKAEGPGGTGLAGYCRKVPLPDRYRGLCREPESGPVYAAYLDQAIRELEEVGTPPAAFIAESILSCGGQVVLPRGYLREAYRRIRAAGGVAIADEVQVGFGRVGTHFWAFETQEVVPDIVVMGKPAGNGHPLGIVVTTPEIAGSFDNGMEFFSTFGGNPVSCAVGLAVLEVIEREGLMARAAETGGYLLGRLADLAQRHSSVGDVRGLGLFLGVELVSDRERKVPDGRLASFLANRIRDKGVLLSTDGPDHNVLKIKPPMCFGRTDADQLVTALESALSEVDSDR